ncbi:WXG100 family type VII secretion target [Actinomycetospora aeridis]|uniref:Excreted virulence factor EspC (Type VII ESX diderm) n=1 Tax=Actinomycetospora aeridis TaxID=3129231 RepID=A0ABU8N3K5_9PSEU
MSEGFDSRPDALGAGAQRFRGVADELGRAVADLRGALGALGDVSGRDEQGRGFAAGYQPRADEGLRALDALARVLAGVPEGLDRAAADYRAGDEAGGRSLGGPP